MPKAIQTGLTQNRSFLFPDVDGRALVTAGALITLAGQSAPRTYTLPDADCGVLTDHAVVTVAQGGSGASSFTAHGVLLGNSSGAFGVTAVGADGTVMIGHTGADPTFSASPTVTSLTLTSFLQTPTITRGADSTLSIQVNSAARWAFDNSTGAGSGGVYSFYPAVDATYDLGSATNRIGTGYFGTSIAAPVLRSLSGNLNLRAAGASAIVFNINSTDLLVFNGVELIPTDNTIALGDSSNRFTSGFFSTSLVTPSISGVSGLLTVTNSDMKPNVGSDNAADLGGTGQRWRSGYFGTALIVGTNPATTGALRLPAGGVLTWGTSNVGKFQIGAAARSVGATGAVGSVATFTVGAADGSFEVSANVLVTTASSHNFTVTVTYTDEGNNARTTTLYFEPGNGGALSTAIINTNGAVPYHGIPLHIRAKAGTTITIGTTGTFTTVTYNVDGLVKQTA